tara:strand:- start:1915 stop:3600 length:1686 start_codon:yes stop_codon:yes gene_type:complete
MAVDPSLMQAYARYGQALGGAQAATDPFSQYGAMLTHMGNQWIKEKEEDKRKFQNYATKHDAIMQKMPGVSHLKGANQEIFSNKIFELVEQGDLALQNGDKAGYQQVMQSLQQIQGEMSKFEGLYEAAKGDLSAASGTAGLNKIFNEDGQYEIMFGEDLSLQIRTATEGGVVDTEYRGIDYFQDRLTPNASEGLTNAADMGIDQILSKAKKYKQFNFDDHTKDFNKIINKMTQDDDILLSLVHDNALALTDKNGEPITIAEKLAQESMSGDWMYEYNRDKTPEQGGYDINRLRAETKKVLEDYFREDFGDKVNAMKPKGWDDNKDGEIDFEKGLPFSSGEKAQIGDHTYVNPGPIQDAYTAMKNGTEFSYGGRFYKPTDDGRYTTEGRDEPITIRNIIDTMDGDKGYIKSDPYFKNLYNTKVWTPTSKTQADIKEQNQKGLASWNMLNKDDDDVAAEALNNFFAKAGMNIKDGDVKFAPFYNKKSIAPSRWIFGSKDAWGTNDITLVDPVSGDPILDPSTKKPYRFSIDGNKEDLQKVIDDINNNPFIKPYIKERTELNMG